MEYECEVKSPGRGRRVSPDTQCRSPSCRSRQTTVICNQMHETKPTVPLRVWVLASASCFAVCAALVLATVVVTSWGSSHHYPDRTYEEPGNLKTAKTQNDQDPEINNAVLEKLSMFKNLINREKQSDDLTHKQQLQPDVDGAHVQVEKKTEKKDKAKNHTDIPPFKPTLPDIFTDHKFKSPQGYSGQKYDLDYYYNNDIYYPDDPLYDDYVQSNSMTSYLLEKIQELYQWIKTDPDFEAVQNSTEEMLKKKGSNNDLGDLLKALNESLAEGNVTRVMLKLKDLYFGGKNYTRYNATNRTLLKNSSDLLSFGMLTLDVMLLHNIQIMAWDNQESVGPKMLQDPEIFAFNALFLDPGTVEAKRQDVIAHKEISLPYLGRRAETEGRGMIDGLLDMGLSAARAALHLGRAYKNAKLSMKHVANRDAIQNQLAKNSDSNAHALHHLRTTYKQNGGQDGGPNEIDCVWFLYCRNLVATSKLAAPFGMMARLNGLALRLIAGELPPDRALETLVTEALTGWTDLQCHDLLPRCSQGEAASMVLDSIVQQHRKGHVDHHKKP